MLLVGTYRDNGLPMRHPLSQTIGNLVKEQSFQKIQLEGFTQLEVGHFVEIAVGVRPSSGLVQAIYQQTDGNPLFVTEVVRLLGRQGIQEERSLAARIPEGIRDAIGRRLAHLSDLGTQVLSIMSVAGREFNFKLLEALKIAPEDKLLDVVEEALSAHFIEESPAEVGLYRFTHALIQESLASELSQPRRVRLHARIAEALEEIYGAQAEAYAAELAYHYSQAEPVVGTEKLVHYCCMAGNQALAAYAHEEALEHFQRGLAAKQRQVSAVNPSIRPNTSGSVLVHLDAEAADLTLGLGLSQVAMFGLQQFHEGIDNLSRAFDYYFDAGDVSQAMAIAQYPFPFWARRIPKVIGLIERALDIVPVDSSQAGRLLSFYGQVMGVDRGDFAGAQEAFRKALEIARKEQDINLEMRALAWSAMTDCFHLHFPGSLQKSQRAMALAHRSNDLQIQIDVYHWAAVVMTLTGDLENAGLRAAAGLELAVRVKDRQRMASLLWTNASVAQMKGDWETARRFGDHALETWHRDPRILGNRTALEYQVGDLSQGEHYLKRLLEATQLADSEPSTEHAILAMEIPLVARVTGVLEMEKICKDTANAVLSQSSTVPLIALIARIGLALLAVYQEDIEEARQEYAVLETTLPGIVVVELSGDRLLGLLSQTMGELDRATAHFEDALAFCRNIGCNPELAWVCFEYANVLLRRNSHEQYEKAISLLEESLSISDELGMSPLMDQVIALKQQVELRPPTSVAPSYPDGLTQREVEVLLLIARGKSNREIAEELVISPNTVVSHVSNIFNKISVSNRTEAATYANRHGLLSW